MKEPVARPWFCDVLELDRWPCAAPELKSAYRRCVLKNHPDKGGTVEEFERAMRAYETAGNELKAAYGFKMDLAS